MIEKLQNHFGLKKLPFSKTIATNNLFETKSLTQVCERLELAAKQEDFALISGAAGSGKSSAIRYFLSRLEPASYPSVYFTAEAYKISDVAKIILGGLQAEIPYNGFAALRALKKLIEKVSNERGIRPIIVIDEAHELPISTLSSIKNITNFGIDSESKMTIILCGQSELINKINMNSLASLRRRIRVRYKISNLSVEEAIKYIDHQMTLAGVGRSIFSDDCKADIFKLSQGVICNINNICHDLLFAALEKDKEIIESSLLEQILIPD